MRILQVTNIISPHQLPLARQIASIVGENNFRFAAVAQPDPERLRLGWRSNDTEEWILRPGENESDIDEYNRWWHEADVVLCGERLFQHMAERLARNQLCFYMSERWWKPPIGRARMLFPSFLKMAMKFRLLAAHPNFHYLSIGPFSAQDISTLAKMEGRIWQWGYFTDTPQPPISETTSDNKLKILWAGRMLAWKQVGILIKAVGTLTKKGIPIELTLIGEGPQKLKLKKLARQQLNEKEFSFIDPVPVSKIAEIMRAHNVYALPSNGYEGWGAVINESMASGLTVVATDQSGAAAAMIENGVNGLICRSGDWRELASCLRQISNNSEFRNELARNAQKSILNSWSPQIAAQRFIGCSQALLQKREPPIYAKGPMSILKN